MARDQWKSSNMRSACINNCFSVHMHTHIHIHTQPTHKGKQIKNSSSHQTKVYLQLLHTLMRLGNRVRVRPMLHVRITKRLKQPVTCLAELTSQWQVSPPAHPPHARCLCHLPPPPPTPRSQVPEDVAPSQEPLPCGKNRKSSLVW